MKSRLRGVVDCNSHGCKLLDKDICSKPFVFAGDVFATGVILTFPLACHLHCTATIYIYRWQPEQAGPLCIFSSLVHGAGLVGAVGWGNNILALAHLLDNVS